jgi:hypothetical protein
MQFKATLNDTTGSSPGDTINSVMAAGVAGR